MWVWGAENKELVNKLPHTPLCFLRVFFVFPGAARLCVRTPPFPMTIPLKTAPPPGDIGSADFAAAHGFTDDFSLDELADVDHRGVCRGEC